MDKNTGDRSYVHQQEANYEDGVAMSGAEGAGKNSSKS